MARFPRCLATLIFLAAAGALLAAAQAPPSPPTQSADSGQAQPGFTYFFTETNRAFEAYFDSGKNIPDPNGNRLVTVKLTKFSDTFRMWIKSNFPEGEMADYAIDQYSIDCEGKTVGEHQITWYDAQNNELTDYDFGGGMMAPITYSMKDILMKKVCGVR